MNQAIVTLLSRLARDYIVLAKACIAILLTVMATWAFSHDVFARLENFTLDQRFRMRAEQFTYSKVVLIEVAEDSIRAVGRWPWDREWHATMVKALKDFGARAIAFDVLFAEEADRQTDDLFAKMIQHAGNVYLPIAFNKTDGIFAGDPVASLPSLKEYTLGEGHITITPDEDGILRRIKLRLRANGEDYLQLGFALALNYFNVEPDEVVFEKNNILIPIRGSKTLKIPLTDEGDYIINWPGTWDSTFRHVSFIDTIASYARWLKGEPTTIPIETFKDALCIVGVSATGLFDIRATPLEAAYPAMGVNATVLSSIIENRFLKPLSDRLNIAILWMISFIIFFIMLHSNYLQTTAAIILIAVSYTSVAISMFVWGNVIMALIYPLFLILTNYLALTAYHQIVISIEKKRLMKLATTDPLTGLFNIAHFKRLLNAELLSTQLRSIKDITVVMADGDYFKKINDTYGHAVGDEVLRGISEILKNNCRTLDVAARYGGEEFILMLPGATLSAGLKVAEKMRLGVEQKKFLPCTDGRKAGFTASFGVAGYRPGEAMDSLLKRADEALYLAKKSGRNRVCTI